LWLNTLASNVTAQVCLCEEVFSDEAISLSEQETAASQ
jgi:hypothetical protein